MKKQVKGAIAVVGALALVIAVGTRLSDHSLKATDGEENIVEEAVVEDVEPVVEETVEENAEIVLGESTEIQTEETVEKTDEAVEEEESEEEESEEKEADEEKEKEEKAKTEKKSFADAKGTISIESNVDMSQPIEEGASVTFTAVVSGFDGFDFHYQWSRSTDGDNWEDIKDANSQKFTFEMNEENSGYMWKVRLVED